MDQKAITAREREEKLAFFRELDKLDEISDAEDNGTAQHPKVTKEKFTSASGLNGTGTLVPGSPDCVFVEARAVPKPDTTGPSSDAISVVKETPYPPQPTKKAVIKNAKEEMEDSPSNRPGGGARGRKKKPLSSFRELPESQKIFKGLVFC